MRQQIRRMIRRLGFDVARTRPRLVDFLADRGVDQVIDVGANTGQFASELRHNGYTGNIISLEPVSSVFAVLEQNAAGDDKWRALKVGAGARSEEVEIHVSEDTRFSSINAMTAAAEEFDVHSRAVASETISIKTLDELFADLAGTIFLKIDTQGHEPNVIAGAGQFLSRVCGVQMELPCIQLYEGSWSFGEAVNRMEASGFKIFQMEPVNYSKADPVALVELDIVFGRPR